MKITFYAFGKIKAKFWRSASTEYLNRIRHYVSIEVKELKDSTISENDIGQAIDDESERILTAVPASSFLVALDSRGQQMTSMALANFFNEKLNYGPANVVFAIGGAFGFSEKVLRRANLVLSLSEMTFPHEMARVILFEQIYRAFSILRNEKYHK